MFPIEVLDVVPCVKRKITDEQTAQMIRQTARPAYERQKGITDWVVTAWSLYSIMPFGFFFQ